MNSALPTKRPTKWRRAAKRSLIALPLILLAMWLTVHHRPGWYRPPVLDADGSQRARREAMGAADDFGDRLVRGEPFTVTLDDTSVNAWLAALPTIWPESREWLPPELLQPAVGFAEGRLRIGARLERRELSTIVSFDVIPVIADDGKSVSIKLAAIRGGALPIPVSMIEPYLKPILAKNADEKQPTPSDALVSFPNRFTWPNGQRRFAIRRIDIQAGKVHLDIEPR